MLFKRLSSAIVGILLTISIIFFAPPICVNILVLILSLMGLYEMFLVLEKANLRPLKYIGYLSSLIILFLGYIDNKISINAAIILILALGFLLMMILTSSKLRISFQDISATFFSIFYIVFMLSFTVLTFYLENGKYLIWYVILSSWATDTFAYFVGTSLGKHKLSPIISPNKTIEGAIGGVIGCVIIFIIYSIVLNTYLNLGINILYISVIAVICSIISQYGDLFASAIKRLSSVKDFGEIMPGHGGILDRIDSLIFVSPFLYYVFLLMFRG